MNPHRCLPETAGCAAAQPNRLLANSTIAGWTSLHLDHLEGSGRSDVFETHPTGDLTLVVASAGRHRIDLFSGGRWRSALYQAATAGVNPPNQTARLRWSTASDADAFRTLHVYLPGSLVAETADEYRRIGQTISIEKLSALAFRDETISGQAKALLTACRNGEPDLYAAGAARWLVTHLLSQQASWRHLADDPRLAATITDRRLARVVEYMSAHLDQGLTLDDLAREAGISAHHFGRRFRETMGLGPTAYLTALRIDRARMLLRTTDLSVAEVGVRCGYPRATGFATAFLRHAGTSPKDYRSAR